MQSGHGPVINARGGRIFIYALARSPATTATLSQIKILFDRKISAKECRHLHDTLSHCWDLFLFEASKARAFDAAAGLSRKNVFRSMSPTVDGQNYDDEGRLVLGPHCWRALVELIFNIFFLQILHLLKIILYSCVKF